MNRYPLALEAHSLLRLALTLLCAWLFWIGLSGWLGRRGPTLASKFLILLTVILADLQLVLGLLLYFLWSPVTASARADYGAAMKDPTLRFFAVEHAGAMLLAVACMHVGKIGAANAGKVGNDTGRYRRVALWFGLALALIVAMSPWPFSSVPRPLWPLGTP